MNSLITIMFKLSKKKKILILSPQHSSSPGLLALWLSTLNASLLPQSWQLVSSPSHLLTYSFPSAHRDGPGMGG